MDPHQVSLCLLHTALKWPRRLPEILEMVACPPVLDPIHAIIWRAVLAAVDAGKWETDQAFRDRMMLYVAAEQASMVPTVEFWVNTVLAQVEPSESCCMSIIRRYSIQTSLSSVSPDMSEADIDRELARIAQANRLGAETHPTPVDLFSSDGENMLENQQQILTGNFLMDGAFNGLPPIGRLVLQVMPTKGGKTLYSVQLAKDLVNKGLDVLYMNFEQEARGDLANRVYSQMTGTKLEVWERAARFTDVPEDVRAVLLQERPKWEKHFKFFSASELAEEGSLPDGAESLKKLVEHEYLDKGLTPPALIILDWWKELWDRFVASMRRKHRAMSEGDLIGLEIIELKKVKLMGQILGSRVLVLHQLRAAIAGTSFNLDRLSMEDSATNKGLIWVADAGIISTTKHPTTGLVAFKLDRCRFKGNNWHGWAKMDGAKGTFVPIDPQDEVQSQYAGIHIPGALNFG